MFDLSWSHFGHAPKWRVEKGQEAFFNKLLGDISAFRRSSRQAKLPVFLTTNEIRKLLQQLKGMHWLMASLLYGSGLRRIELVRLRIKNVDIDHLQLRIWNGKGAKHRLVTLAPEWLPSLKRQIADVGIAFEKDKSLPDFTGAWMPDALARKYPSASKSLGWQYLFPASKPCYEPGTCNLR